jgi:hypothetical protein
MRLPAWRLFLFRRKLRYFPALALAYFYQYMQQPKSMSFQVTLLLVFQHVAPAAAGQSTAAHNNVLFIVVDNLRCGDVDCPLVHTSAHLATLVSFALRFYLVAPTHLVRTSTTRFLRQYTEGWPPANSADTRLRGILLAAFFFSGASSHSTPMLLSSITQQHPPSPHHRVSAGLRWERTE